MRGQPDEPGATTTFNEATITTEGTLHFGGIHGPVAGLEGKITFSTGKGPEAEPTPGQRDNNPIGRDIHARDAPDGGAFRWVKATIAETVVERG